jgi:predicted esterase
MQPNKLLEYNYIYEPSDNDSKNTLLLLHGTGGDEYNLLELGKQLDPYAHVISPRGNVLENGHNRFFERISEGVFNIEDIKKRAEDLSNFIAAAKDKYKLHDTNLIAIGFSNGANIAAAILLLHPDILSGAILFRAMMPLRPPHKPHLKGKPVILLSGKDDTMMDPKQVEELVTFLRESGAQVTHEWLDASHRLTNQDKVIAKRWLETTFK